MQSFGKVACLGLLLVSGATAVSVRGAETLKSVDVEAHAGLESPKALEDTLLSLLKDGSANTPALGQFISQIQKLLQTEMQPKVLETKEGEQRRLDLARHRFNSCDSGLDAQGPTVGNLVANAQEAAAAVTKARAEEAAAIEASAQCAKTLAAYKSLEAATCGALDQLIATQWQCPAATRSRTVWGNQVADLAQRFANLQKEWEQKNQTCNKAAADVASQQPKCTQASVAAAAATEKRKGLESTADQISCSAFKAGASSCSAHATCYADALTGFTAAVVSAKNQEQGFKSEWDALGRISCLTTIFANNDANKQQAIKECRDKEVDTSKLSLVYPQVPAKRTCIPPQGVSCK